MVEKFSKPEQVTIKEEQEEIQDGFNEYSAQKSEGFIGPEDDIENSVIKAEADEFFAEYELAQLRKFPKDERRFELETIKGLLIHQKDGLITIQSEIMEAVKVDPYICLEDLLTIARSLYEGYKINRDQQDIIERIIQDLYEKHAAVCWYCEGYPDPQQLYRVILQRQPKGKIEVIQGPVTIYFRCADTEDYSFINKQAFLRQNQQLSEKDIEESMRSGGVSISTCPISELRGTIIAENSNGDLSFGQWEASVLKHEEEHALDRLVEQKIIYQKYNKELLTHHKDGDGVKRMILIRYFRALRAEQENRIKTELLAYLTNQDSSRDEIIYILTKKKKNGGLYDYFSDTKEEIVRDLDENFEPSLLEHYRHLIEKVFFKVFTVEVVQLISDCLEAYDRLRSSGFRHEEAIARLRIEPIRKWQKESKREEYDLNPPTEKLHTSDFDYKSKW